MEQKLMSVKSGLVKLVSRHARVARFIVVGGLNTAIDISLYAILANSFHIKAVLASIISTGITLVFSFFMNHRFVFKSEKKKGNTALRFILVTLVNVWGVQSLVITFVLHYLEHIDALSRNTGLLNLVAKLCGVSVSMILNYIAYHYIFGGDTNAKQQEN